MQNIEKHRPLRMWDMKCIASKIVATASLSFSGYCLLVTELNTGAVYSHEIVVKALCGYELHVVATCMWQSIKLTGKGEGSEMIMNTICTVALKSRYT